MIMVDPVTIWLTGLPASGKTTLAKALVDALVALKQETVCIDGDELRRNLHVDLGFSREDRAEQVRRVAELCRTALARGSWPIVALVSPFRTDRESAYRRIGFALEVYVATNVGICRARDPKGIYAQAVRGERFGLTGWDAPYEPPTAPGIVYDAGRHSVQQGVESILTVIRGGAARRMGEDKTATA